MKVFNTVEEAMTFLKIHNGLDLIKIEDELRTKQCSRVNGIGLVFIDELYILD
jgi:ATP-dependent protease HslVU (ClpYQ) ATPase subunit